jgi:hypothetical protein
VCKPHDTHNPIIYTAFLCVLNMQQLVCVCVCVRACVRACVCV